MIPSGPTPSHCRASFLSCNQREREIYHSLTLSSSLSLCPHLHIEVVHGIHGQGLNNLQVFEYGVTARQAHHHPVIMQHRVLTGGKRVNITISISQ